ncbi:MAG: YiiX/YebB-like N1pC/P60 family cysteine hydrolase [Nitrososphaerota archaeon]
MLNVFFKDKLDLFLETLKPGDIILFSGESWISKSIQWFTDSKWNHVAFYVGDGYIIESTEVGVEKNLLKNRLKHCNELLVRRCILIQREEDINFLILKAHDMIYRGYDFLQFLGLGIYFLFRKIGIRLRFLVPNSRQRFICSEFIYFLFLHIGIHIGKRPELVTPQSIAQSGNFIDISSLVLNV